MFFLLFLSSLPFPLSSFLFFPFLVLISFGMMLKCWRFFFSLFSFSFPLFLFPPFWTRLKDSPSSVAVLRVCWSLLRCWWRWWWWDSWQHHTGLTLNRTSQHSAGTTRRVRRWQQGVNTQHTLAHEYARVKIRVETRPSTELRGRGNTWDTQQSHLALQDTLPKSAMPSAAPGLLPVTTFQLPRSSCIWQGFCRIWGHIQG